MRIPDFGIRITHETARSKAGEPAQINVSYILVERTDRWDRVEWLKAIMTSDFYGRSDEAYHLSFTKEGYPCLTTTVNQAGWEWVKEKYSS